MLGDWTWPTKSKIRWDKDFKLPYESESWSVYKMKGLCKPMENMSFNWHYVRSESSMASDETIVTFAIISHGVPFSLTNDMENASLSL